MDRSIPFVSHGLSASLRCFLDVFTTGAWLLMTYKSVQKDIKFSICISCIPVVINAEFMFWINYKAIDTKLGKTSFVKRCQP